MKEIRWVIIAGLLFVVGILFGSNAHGSFITINPASDFNVITATTTVSVLQEQKDCVARGGQFTFMNGEDAHYTKNSISWDSRTGYNLIKEGDLIPTTSPSIDCTVPTHTLWHKELSI